MSRDEPRWLRDAFEELGRAPRPSSEAARVLEERQTRCGVRFPAAFVEFYSSVDAFELLAEWFDAGSLASDEWSEEVARTSRLRLPGASSQSGSLVVRTDAGDDPPVLVDDLDGGESVGWPRFSQFVYELALDFRPARVGASLLRPSDDSDLLGPLGKMMRRRPQTTAPGGRVEHRFTRGTQSVVVSLAPNAPTEWSLGAGSEEELVELAGELFALGVTGRGETSRGPGPLVRACAGCKAPLFLMEGRCSWCGEVVRWPGMTSVDPPPVIGAPRGVDSGSSVNDRGAEAPPRECRSERAKDDLEAYVRELAALRCTRDELMDALARKGVSEADARELADRHLPPVPVAAPFRNSAAGLDLTLGIVLVLTGLGVTLFGPLLAVPGGRYPIAIGAIAVGAWRVWKGLRG